MSRASLDLLPIGKKASLGGNHGTMQKLLRRPANHVLIVGILVLRKLVNVHGDVDLTTACV